MLQGQLNELKSLGSRGNATRIASFISTPVDSDGINELVGRISTLDGLIGKQSSSLLELQNKCDLLLKDDLILKDNINILKTNFDEVQGSHREINKIININNISKICNSSTGSDQVADSVYACQPMPHATTGMTVYASSHAGVGDGTARSGDVFERCEIIINSVLKENCDASEEIVNEIAFAALNKVLPTLERLSVAGTRILRSRGLSEKQDEEPGAVWYQDW